MNDSKLSDYLDDIVYGFNPAGFLSYFSDCIVAGNKNLDVIADAVQGSVTSAQSEVSSFLASVSNAMAAVSAAKEAKRIAEANDAKRKKKAIL